MKEMIIQFCQNCSIHDLEKFASKYSLSCSHQELEMIHSFVQKHVCELLDGKEDCFKELNGQISSSLYEQLYTMYLDAKELYL